MFGVRVQYVANVETKHIGPLALFTSEKKLFRARNRSKGFVLNPFYALFWHIIPKKSTFS